MSLPGFFFYPILFLLSYLSSAVAQGIGTSKCSDAGLDWYTGKVGETPCRTYERLRQICNTSFRVGNMNPNTPPDFCNEQVANCCCNSIAFSLAMLCLTCQQGLGTSGNGIDAGVGAYQLYLQGSRTSGFCSPQVNKTLPSDVQSAVCNQNINIYDDLYNFFWGDGQWFYIFTSQTITKDQLANPDKVFTKCPKTSSLSSSQSTSSSSTSSASPSDTSAGTGSTNNANADTNSDSSGGLSTGGVAGIAVGVALGVVGAAIALFFWFRRRKRAQGERYVSAGGVSVGGPNDGPPPPAPQAYTYTPVQNHSRHALNTSQRDPRAVTLASSPPGMYGRPQTGHSTTSYFPDSSAVSHSQGSGPWSPTSNDTSVTGTGYPLTYTPPRSNGSSHADYTHHAAGFPQSVSGSSSGGGSASGYTSNESRNGFVVSNPDAVRRGDGGPGSSSSGSAYTRSERLTSPYSPTTTSASSTSGPHPSSLPGKASLNMRNARYVPPAAGADGERHMDAGPVPGATGLSRNLSGRLPPAYGDLVRETG